MSRCLVSKAGPNGGPLREAATVKQNGIFERLRSDHRNVLERMGAVERQIVAGRSHLSAAVLASLRDFATHLECQFDTHLRAEDEVLYPTLARRMTHGRALIEPLHLEHAELRAMLEGFQNALASPFSAKRDEQIVIQLRDLVDLLRIHIRKEEALLFGVAERLLEPSDLVELESLRRLGGTRTRRIAASPRKKGTS